MDFALIVLIFGEFFLFLAIVSYFGMRREKRKETKTKDFPFFEAVWTKSKMVLTVYPDHLEMFVPSSRVRIQEKQEIKQKSCIIGYARMHAPPNFFKRANTCFGRG